jgi:hypothetical protein
MAPILSENHTVDFNDNIRYRFSFEIMEDAPQNLWFQFVRATAGSKTLSLNAGLNVDDCEALSAMFANAAEVMRNGRNQTP